MTDKIWQYIRRHRSGWVEWTRRHIQQGLAVNILSLLNISSFAT